MHLRPSDFEARGAAQGEISPRLPDCYQHCQVSFEQELDSKVASEEQANDYAFGCVSHCVVQLSSQIGLQCYEAMGADSPQQWQELYLARGLAEKTAFCLQEVREGAPEAKALIAAVDAEHKTRAAIRAREREREALLSRDPALARLARKARTSANATPEWQTALSAYQRWNVPTESAVGLLTCLDSLPLRVCGQPALGQ